MQEKVFRRYRILVRRNVAAFRHCSALVTWKMDIRSGERWRTEEKVPVLREPEPFSEIPVPSSNPRTFRKYNQSCIARQCTVTRRFHRVNVSRRKRKRNWGQQWIMVWFQEESVSKQADMLCSSLLWIRWIMKLAWVNPYATCPKQESRHTKILGNTFRIQYFGAIWSSLDKEVWNFIKQDQTLLFSTTHCLQSLLRAICMKTKDQLYQWESVILRLRVVLKANSQSGSHDLLVQDARSSWESQQDAEIFGETRSNTADYRVPGISISTVKLQDTRRQNNVTKLVEMFEKHRHKKQFLKDMCQKQERHRFSEESQQLLVDMNSTEIFELCENSAKLQCLDCNSFAEIGIICAVAGEIWSTSGVLQQTRRRITTVLQSVALSSRRILLEDQSTAIWTTNHVPQGEGDA